MPTPASAQLRIVTTTTDLGDFARTIGGDRVRVETICSGVQDPHFVQTRPSYMVTLSRADLVIAVGLDLEIGWLPSLIAGARNPDINPGRAGYLDASEAVTPLGVPSGPVDRSHGDIHPQGNPHYWLDPQVAVAVVRLIAQRMASMAPGDADTFRANLRSFETRIARAQERWTQAMGRFRGTKVVSYHRTFNYFLRRFGLLGVGYVEERPGIPPAPAHLARLIRMIREEGISVIFHAVLYERATSDLVAARTDARVLHLPTSVGGVPGASNYERLIDTIVDAFVRAAGSPRG